MDEDKSNTIGGDVDTSKWDRSMWLMKCPELVARSIMSPPSDDSPRPVAKVILSIDPLQSKYDSSSTQFTMELISTEFGNPPKRYCMDMSKVLTPVSVFAESSQGKISVEGKIKYKFDMRPHHENMENYGKLCLEQTNKYMTNSRQIQDALLKSNEVFETFKQEIEKMAKSIEKLKKENMFLKSKCEKSDVALIELLEEHERLKKQLEESKSLKEKQSLQAERKQNSVGSNNSDSAPE